MRKKKTSPNKQPATVRLNPGIKKRLERLGKKKARSSHWLMQAAIERYVAEEEAKEKLKEETIKRWEEAKQGKVISNQSVITWLESWGTDKEEEKPQ